MLNQPILRNTFALLAICLLSACGFHLRNHSELPSSLEPIYIGGAAANGQLASALRYQLTNSDTKVVPYPAAANYRLMLLKEGHQKRIISLDKRGLAAEYGLISTIEFELLDRGGHRVLGPLELQELRTVTNNPDNPLTTSQEIGLVQTDIYKTLAALLVRRLGAFANHMPQPAAAPIDDSAAPANNSTTPPGDAAAPATDNSAPTP